MPPGDLELLHRFSRHGDEMAFATLVDRHLPMVYSAARRIASTEGHLAPDVAQRVFTNLAAHLPRVMAHLERAAAHAASEDGAPQPSIIGWLHRDTRFIAMDMLRKETRRRRREVTAALTEPDSADPEPDWSRLRGFIDQSLDELAAPDREALLLRFFHDRGPAAIGTVLGTSPDAARKRIERALERLRQRLAGRGVSCTAAALALACGTHGLEAPPAGLSPRLARQALSSAASTASPTAAALSSLMSSTLPKTVLITVGLGLGLVLTLHRINQPPADSATGRFRGDAPSHTPSETAAVPDVGTRNGSRKGHPTQTQTDAAEADALARLREALYADNLRPSRMLPDPSIRTAIEAWTGRRHLFVPLLREALASDRPDVVARAASGIMVLGPEALDCGEDIIPALRNNSNGRTLASLGSALAKLGPAPDLLPGVLAVLREKPQHNVAFTACLGSLAGEDPATLHAALAPLLRDPDPLLQELAAGVLVNANPSLPDPELLRIGIASLSSENLNSQHLGLEIITRSATSAPQGGNKAAAQRLGAATDDVVAALIQVANHSQLAERRTRARKLLDQLEPELRRDNPGFDRWLSEQEATDQFRRRIATGHPEVAELVDGLSRHPGASDDVARRLAEYGPEARSALPSLHRALAALDPQAKDSPFDRSTAFESRGRIVEAIRKIAPDQPSPIFSRGDVQKILEPLSARSNPRVSEDTVAALQKVLTESAPDGFNPGEELQPDQLRRILSAIGQTDPALRDALLAAAQAVDPNFRSE